MMWSAKLVAAFPNAKRRAKGINGHETYDVCCPVHNEKHSSATLTIKDDKAIINCQVCKLRMSQATYFTTLLQQTGLSPADWYADSAGRSSRGYRRPRQMNIEDVYPYRDIDGTLLFEVVRGREAGGRKTFRARRPRTPEDKKEPGDDAAYVWEQPTVSIMDQGILYNWPAVMKQRAGPVVICEGEKDADSLNACGIIATTNAFGAGNWGIQHARHLADRRCLVTEDNDDAGIRRTGFVAGSLIVGGAAEIRVLRFTNLEPGGDVTDFLYQAIEFVPTKPYHRALEVFNTKEKINAARCKFINHVRHTSILWRRINEVT